MDAWIIGLTLSGRADLRIGSEPLHTTPGTVTILRPGTFNSWRIPTGQWECLYSAFVPRAHWYPWLQYPEIAPGYSLLKLSAAVTAGVRQQLLRIHAWTTGSAPLRQEFALNALEHALLLAHSEHLPETPVDPRVRQAADYLCTHLDEPILLDRLAKICGMSRSHLAYLFKAQLGTSPLAFHERQRLMQAERRLRLSYDSVEEIARMFAFCDAKYFSRRFRRLTGKSPRDIRQR